jgi:hypothetical protein
MAFDKNKPKILKLDEAFNTIAGLSQDLRDQAYKLDIVRSKQNLNKNIIPEALMISGALSAGSYVAFGINNLNPGLIHLISSVILVGLGLKLGFLTSPFGKLIETPLKFNLLDLTNNKPLSKSELLAIGAELPDPILFYELGDSSFEFKVSKPNLTPTKTGNSEFVKKETTDAGKPEEKSIYTWNNKKSSEYALIFDEESQKIIKEIIRIYEKPSVKENFQRYWPLLATGVAAGTLAALEPPISRALRPKNNKPAVQSIVPSDLSDITPLPKKKTPSRQQLIERLKK